MSSADAQTKTGIEAVQAGGDAMLGMAAFGKTALVLVAMVGLSCCAAGCSSASARARRPPARP